MVLYFSATGNTEFIAKQIAKRNDDEALNLLTRIKEKDYSPLHSEKPFVICSPIYVCEMPRFFASFIKQLPLLGNRQVYFIFTSGGYEGIAGSLARLLAMKKKMIFMGWAGFKMPRNYPVSKSYPLLSYKESKERIKGSCDKIPKIVSRIKHGKKLRSRYITQLEKIITLPFNPVWVKYMHTAKPFYTTDKCVGCGKCVSACPKHLIELIPYDAGYAVACSSKGKGPDAMKKCSVSCIGCGLCKKNCPNDAVTVDSFLAHIDQDKCVACGACAAKCPKKCIHEI